MQGLTLVPLFPIESPPEQSSPLDPVFYDEAGVTATVESSGTIARELWVRHDKSGNAVVEFEVALQYKNETLLTFIADYCEERLGPHHPDPETLLSNRGMCCVQTVSGPYHELAATDEHGIVICRLRMADTVYHPVFDVLFTCHFRDERRRRTSPQGPKLL